MPDRDRARKVEWQELVAACKLSAGEILIDGTGQVVFRSPKLQRSQKPRSSQAVQIFVPKFESEWLCLKKQQLEQNGLLGDGADFKYIEQVV